MKDTVLITDLEHAFSLSLAEVFAREGFRVFAMGGALSGRITPLPSGAREAAAELEKQAGKLDFLIDTTDVYDPADTFTLSDGIDAAVMERVFRQNVLRPMRILENVLPLLDAGEGRRLFYLTGAGASINGTRCVSGIAYAMSKASLHQFIQMTRNKLAPKGYTFRVFDPMHGRTAPEAAAESAYHYITRRRGTENHDPLRDDEENLVFRDAQGRQHPW
ncbi:MAG: SDR family NAD(P)-dependent oxidoreductase [Oscillospiraceae bacterium]|nr:SDR family NAD(P)-dependent oxidoreductase [Oscillospiraceae bacterium]